MTGGTASEGLLSCEPHAIFSKYDPSGPWFLVLFSGLVSLYTKPYAASFYKNPLLWRKTNYAEYYAASMVIYWKCLYVLIFSLFFGSDWLTSAESNRKSILQRRFLKYFKYPSYNLTQKVCYLTQTRFEIVFPCKTSGDLLGPHCPTRTAHSYLESHWYHQFCPLQGGLGHLISHKLSWAFSWELLVFSLEGGSHGKFWRRVQSPWGQRLGQTLVTSITTVLVFLLI